MRLKSISAAVAALGLVSAPVVAQAASQPLPRSGSELAEGESLGGGGYLVPILALIAVVLGILAATGGDDDDLPVSP